MGNNTFVVTSLLSSRFGLLGGGPLFPAFFRADGAVTVAMSFLDKGDAVLGIATSDTSPSFVND